MLVARARAAAARARSGVLQTAADKHAAIPEQLVAVGLSSRTVKLAVCSGGRGAFCRRVLSGAWEVDALNATYVMDVAGGAAAGGADAERLRLCFREVDRRWVIVNEGCAVPSPEEDVLFSSGLRARSAPLQPAAVLARCHVPATPAGADGWEVRGGEYGNGALEPQPTLSFEGGESGPDLASLQAALRHLAPGEAAAGSVPAASLLGALALTEGTRARIIDELSVPQLWILRRVCRKLHAVGSARLDTFDAVAIVGGAGGLPGFPTPLSSIEALSAAGMRWLTIKTLPPLPTDGGRIGVAAAALSGGDLAAIGGRRRDATSMDVSGSALRLDPAAEFPAWMPLPVSRLSGRQLVKRAGASAVALPGGGVLVMGGCRSNGGALKTCEQLDAAAWDEREGRGMRVQRVFGAEEKHLLEMANRERNRPYTRQDMGVERAEFASGLLPDGRVIVAGGLSGKRDHRRAIRSVEIYDPATDSWSNLPPLLSGRVGCAGCVLGNGDFVVTGGTDDEGRCLASCEVFDCLSSDPCWTELPEMQQARAGHAAAALAAGDVLVIGGEEGEMPLDSCEMLHRYRQVWLRVACLNQPRRLAAAIISPKIDMPSVNLEEQHRRHVLHADVAGKLCC